MRPYDKRPSDPALSTLHEIRIKDVQDALEWRWHYIQVAREHLNLSLEMGDIDQKEYDEAMESLVAIFAAHVEDKEEDYEQGLETELGEGADLHLDVPIGHFTDRPEMDIDDSILDALQQLTRSVDTTRVKSFIWRTFHLVDVCLYLQSCSSL